MGAEKDAAKAFEDFKKDSESSIKDKETEVENNEADIASAVDAITEAMDLRNEAMELKKAAEKELMKLKPMCVDPPDTYAQRVKKRQDEIQALKDAMRMLDEM